MCCSKGHPCIATLYKINYALATICADLCENLWVYMLKVVGVIAFHDPPPSSDPLVTQLYDCLTPAHCILEIADNEY